MSGPAPSTTFLRELGPDLGWPAGWRAALAGVLPPTPVERLRLLAGAHRRVLVASVGGRARLRRWLDEQRGTAPVQLPRWLLEEWIADRVSFYGDPSLLPVVVAALCLVPKPVRDAVVAETAFLAVGVDSAAWTGSANLADREGVRKARVVALGPSVDVRVVLHEVAHCWHSALPDEHSSLITTRGEAGLWALASREDWHPRMDTHIAKDERLADACAFCWGAEVK
jgi:hypothetical protein